jgi:hypothetical protein
MFRLILLVNSEILHQVELASDKVYISEPGVRNTAIFFFRTELPQ